MEEVEQFDNISIEDLAEGVSVPTNSDLHTLTTDDVVQSYRKTLRGSSSYRTSRTTKMGESLSLSCSLIGLLPPAKSGC